MLLKTYKKIKIKFITKINVKSINNIILIILNSRELKVKRLGIARGLFNLVEYTNQRILKSNGFLTRNSSCKERRILSCYLKAKKHEQNKKIALKLLVIESK